MPMLEHPEFYIKIRHTFLKYKSQIMYITIKTSF